MSNWNDVLYYLALLCCFIQCLLIAYAREDYAYSDAYIYRYITLTFGMLEFASDKMPLWSHLETNSIKLSNDQTLHIPFMVGFCWVTVQNQAQERWAMCHKLCSTKCDGISTNHPGPRTTKLSRELVRIKVSGLWKVVRWADLRRRPWEKPLCCLQQVVLVSDFEKHTSSSSCLRLWETMCSKPRVLLRA